MIQSSTKDALYIRSAIREVLQHGFIYGITSSLQSVVGFVLLPIVTNYLAPELFGIYSILLLIGSFASAIFYLGASSALGRFYFDDDSVEHKRKVITAAFVVTVIGALLLFSLSVIFASEISQILFHTKIYAKHVVLALTGSSVSFLLNLMVIIA
jgi:O-antigen/teichoic acid export membrane protein